MVYGASPNTGGAGFFLSENFSNLEFHSDRLMSKIWRKNKKTQLHPPTTHRDLFQPSFHDF